METDIIVKIVTAEIPEDDSDLLQTVQSVMVYGFPFPFMMTFVGHSIQSSAT